MVDQKAGPDLGALGVEQNCHRRAELAGDAAYALDVLAVIVM